VVLLDDAGRDDEKTIVDMWTRQFPEFTSEFIDLEKGAVVLIRSK